MRDSRIWLNGLGRLLSEQLTKLPQIDVSAATPSSVPPLLTLPISIEAEGRGSIGVSTLFPFQLLSSEESDVDPTAG